MITLSEQNAFMADVARLIVYIQQSGYTISGGELWRPEEMQKIYFKQGKSKTMKNSHGDRLAVDLNFFDMASGQPTLTYDKSKLQMFGDYWETLDIKNRWGGNWKTLADTPHFERKFL